MEQVAAVAVLESRSVVEARLDLSTSVIYREMQAGRLARPLRVSPGRVAWLKSDIDQYIADRVAERDARAQQQRDERARGAERVATMTAATECDALVPATTERRQRASRVLAPPSVEVPA